MLLALLLAQGGFWRYPPIEAKSLPEGGVSLRSGTIALLISAHRGGLPAELQAKTSWGWERLDVGRPIGDLLLSVGGRESRLSEHEGRVGIVKSSGEEAAVEATASLPCGLNVSMRYTAFPEGALFCQLSLQAKKPLTVEGMSLLFPFRCDFPEFRWFWRGSEWHRRKRAVLGESFLPRGEGRRERFCVAGFDFGQKGSFGAHLSVALERFGGFEGLVEFPSEGSMAIGWRLDGPIELGPGKVYQNRWALCVSSARSRDLAIGQRIAHWQEGGPNLMAFPPNSAIKAMADCGVSVCVLHLYWHKPGEAWPVSWGELRRWLRECHKRGIKCVLYAGPMYTNPPPDVFFPKTGADGIYFDFGSIHFFYRPPGLFPALRGFLFMRRMRELVGPRGLIVNHCSAGWPDALFCLDANAHLPGEAGQQQRFLEGPKEALYFGGATQAVVHPWMEYAPWRTERAVALYAAVGAFPHLLFGRGTHQDNNFDRCVYISGRWLLPLWQIWRSLPMDEHVEMFSIATGRAAFPDKEGVYAVAFTRGGREVLVVVSNLGPQTEARVCLDRCKLRLHGAYRLFELRGRRIEEFEVLDRGRFDSDAIEAGRLGQFEVKGFLLLKDPSHPHFRRFVKAVRRLARAYVERKPPSKVKGLEARAEPGLVRLAWREARDNSHVAAYRVYRSEGPDFVPSERNEVARVDEATYFLDKGVAPGRLFWYRVRAEDVAGNLGPPSEPVRAEAPAGDLLTETFDDGLRGNWEFVKGRWEVRGGRLWQLSGVPVATREGYFHRFERPVEARFWRAVITGGRHNFEHAHIVEFEVYEAGTGRNLALGRPVRASSVDTFGAPHLPQFAVDGSRDRERAWWSGRGLPLPQWLEVDLGEVRKVGAVRLVTYYDGRRSYFYRILASKDGKKWTEVARLEAPFLYRALVGEGSWTDYEVWAAVYDEARKRSGMGIVFRSPNSESGYLLYLGPGFDGYLHFAKLEGGRLEVLKKAPFWYSVYRLEPHILRAVAVGDRIRCYCDGILAFDMVDKTFRKGRVGLASLLDPAAFDNLVVKGAKGG